MENQHRKIKGYRDLSQGEIDLMNEIKSAGVLLQSIVDKVQKHIDDQYSVAANVATDDEYNRLNAAQPHMWVSEATIDLQTGLMKLTRSVAQPGFF